jgi:hypothetical protein
VKVCLDPVAPETATSEQGSRNASAISISCQTSLNRPAAHNNALIVSVETKIIQLWSYEASSRPPTASDSAESSREFAADFAFHLEASTACAQSPIASASWSPWHPLRMPRRPPRHRRTHRRQFEYAPDQKHVLLDIHASHLWGASTIAALDAITEKYRRHGTDVKIIGLNSPAPRARTPRRQLSAGN